MQTSYFSQYLEIFEQFLLAFLVGSAGVALGENATICYNYIINLHSSGLMMLIMAECFYWLSAVTSFAWNGKGNCKGCSLRHN